MMERNNGDNTDRPFSPLSSQHYKHGISSTAIAGNTAGSNGNDSKRKGGVEEEEGELEEDITTPTPKKKVRLYFDKKLGEVRTMYDDEEIEMEISENDINLIDEKIFEHHHSKQNHVKQLYNLVIELQRKIIQLERKLKAKEICFNDSIPMFALNHTLLAEEKIYDLERFINDYFRTYPSYDYQLHQQIKQRRQQQQIRTKEEDEEDQEQEEKLIPKHHNPLNYYYEDLFTQSRLGVPKLSNVTTSIPYNFGKLPNYDKDKKGLVEDEDDKERKFEGSCFNCTQTGHSVQECPYPTDQRRIRRNRRIYMDQKPTPVGRYFKETSLSPSIDESSGSLNRSVDQSPKKESNQDNEKDNNNNEERDNKQSDTTTTTGIPTDVDTTTTSQPIKSISTFDIIKKNPNRSTNSLNVSHSDTDTSGSDKNTNSQHTNDNQTTTTSKSTSKRIEMEKYNHNSDFLPFSKDDDNQDDNNSTGYYPNDNTPYSPSDTMPRVYHYNHLQGSTQHQQMVQNYINQFVNAHQNQNQMAHPYYQQQYYQQQHNLPHHIQPPPQYHHSRQSPYYHGSPTSQHHYSPQSYSSPPYHQPSPHHYYQQQQQQQHIHSPPPQYHHSASHHHSPSPPPHRSQSPPPPPPSHQHREQQQKQQEICEMDIEDGEL